jgi:hypothetical protein
VDSTDGFPTTGSINIDTDRIDYTGKTSTSFTGCTSVSAHDDDSVVNSWVVEISNTAEGSAITWESINKDTDYDIEFDTGKVRLYKDDLLTNTNNALGEVPQWQVPNRFRFTGQWGNSTIPGEITHLLILMVCKSLYGSQVLNAIDRGTNGFSSNGITDIRSEIDRLIMKHTNVWSDNV